MIEMTQEKVIELVESGEKVVLDFYTDTCSVCKTLAIQLEEVEGMTDTPIVKVNAETHSTLAERFGIMKVPQLIVVENNEESRRHMGFIPAPAIVDFIR